MNQFEARLKSMEIASRLADKDAVFELADRIYEWITMGQWPVRPNREAPSRFERQVGGKLTSQMG